MIGPFVFLTECAYTEKGEDRLAPARDHAYDAALVFRPARKCRTLPHAQVSRFQPPSEVSFECTLMELNRLKPAD